MLKVFYGWTKINKVRKAEAISVIFENCAQNEEKKMRFLNRMQHTVYTRLQTEEEQHDASFQNRTFTEYSIRLDDKSVRGDLEKALQINFEADKNHVSEEERNVIRQELRKHYKLYHCKQ